MTCRKVKYPSKECAIYGAWLAEKDKGWNLHPYKCYNKHCLYWHLTQKETDWTFETEVFKGWMRVEKKLATGKQDYRRKK